MPSYSRVRDWLLRYGPAEILSTMITLEAALAVKGTGGREVLVALTATWAGNLTYYSVILAQDVWSTRQKLQLHGRRYTLGILGRNARALVVEFGPAEALDALLSRPALMYWLPRAIHSLSWGVLAAKFAADVGFYIPTLISYELSKRRLRTF